MVGRQLVKHGVRWLVAAALLALAAVGPAQAQIGSERYSSMVIEASSGRVISAVNADEYRFPASLTKLMTMYLAFEALRDGRLRLTDTVPVSAWASAMPPTKLFLRPGTVITVEQVLLGLVTKSANDAACALGELLGGDEEHFAELMTVRAHALGMTRTTFRNASGLPDWGQVTTAHDLLVLARHIQQDFPQYYHYFATPAFPFHGRMVLNHQTMLRTYAGADGMKTGYTEASGYNVVTSAVRGNVRLIGVVLGAGSGGERDVHMAALLDQGFAQLGQPPVEVARADPAPHYSFFSTARAAPLVREPTVREMPEYMPRQGFVPRRASLPRPSWGGRSPPRAYVEREPPPQRQIGVAERRRAMPVLMAPRAPAAAPRGRGLPRSAVVKRHIAAGSACRAGCTTRTAGGAGRPGPQS